MADSRRLAGLVGPALVALALSEALNLGIWAGHAEQSLAPAYTVFGTMLLVGAVLTYQAYRPGRG